MFFIRNLRAVIISALAIPASIISSFTLMRRHGVHAEQHDAARHHASPSASSSTTRSSCWRTSSATSRRRTATPFEAAIQGTREVALAVMATTLSLVVIFLPIAFMNGYAKRYINPFGWTMAFSIMVSMLVSFTLTPMLSSRFLKLSDAAADHKTKEEGFFHWLDTLVHAPGQLGARPLRRHHRASRSWRLLADVPAELAWSGREFVPDEDMGEWTIHMDAPEGTSLDGHDRDRVQAAEGDQRHRGRRADRAARSACRARGSQYAHPLPVSGAAARVTARTPRRKSIAEMRRRLAPYPSYRPIDHGAQRARQRRRHRRIRDLGEHPRTRPAAARRVLEAGAGGRRRRRRASPTPKISLSVSNPEIHVAVDRKRAADLGVRMSTIGNTLRLAVAGDDEISFYKEGPEQYPVKIRVLENQRRDVEEIGRLTVPSADRAGAHRQHRDASSAGLGPSDAAAVEPPVRGEPDRRRRARATRSTKRRTTSAAS